jgi:hypothetical protein
MYNEKTCSRSFSFPNAFPNLHIFAISVVDNLGGSPGTYILHIYTFSQVQYLLFVGIFPKNIITRLYSLEYSVCLGASRRTPPIRKVYETQYSMHKHFKLFTIPSMS